MSSSFGALNTAVRGLYAQQLGLSTVGHNIANASTEGYSRQRVNLSATPTETIYGSRGQAQLGTGVTMESITRLRDTFIDRQYWKENSTLGRGEIQEEQLGRLEGVFAEPSDTGIQTVLNNFWQAWQSLSTNASDSGTRAALRQRGVEVADSVQHAQTQLQDLLGDNNSVLEIKVGRVNEISAEILSLNQQVARVEMSGVDNANDLRDRRDLLTDELNKLVRTQVFEDADGNYAIKCAGVTLVDGSTTTELAVKSGKDNDYGYEYYDVVVKNANPQVALSIDNGEIKGLLDARDTTKSYMDFLSNISQFLLTQFNEVHRSGYGLNDETGYNFFGRAGNTSASDYQNSAVSGSFTKGDWLKELAVNIDLNDVTTGLDKIAAKTLASDFAANLLGTTVPGGAAVTLGGTYSGDPHSTFALTVDASATPPGVAYTVTDSSGTVRSGSAVQLTPATTPPTYQLADGLTIQFSASPAVGSGTFSFQVPQNGACGANAVLLGNALKTSSVKLADGSGLDFTLLGNTSLDSYYTGEIGRLGVAKQSATRLKDNQSTLLTQITNWRESTSGVNMDEEMTNMIKFQKGYNAAARVVTALDEMLDKLVNSTGVVGR